MPAGDGVFRPFRHIGCVVGDALQILGNHQHVQIAFTVGRVLRDGADQIALDAVEQTVHHVVIGNDLPREAQVVPDERGDAAADHMDRACGHAFKIRRHAAALPGGEAGKLRNVRRLISDALKVGDDLQRGGYLPQLARHRLLAQQQPHAERLDGTLLAVNPAFGLLRALAHGLISA